MKTTDVIYREDLYPRFKPNPAKIQEYSQNLSKLPPIEVNQDNILIDGYHRLKAYETEQVLEIPCVVTETKSEMQLLMLAVSRNATHGLQLTNDEKRRYAVRWWDVLPEKEICETLSISDRSFRSWTQDKRKQKEAEIKQTIWDMWLACYNQEAIAEQVSISLGKVNEIANNFKNGNASDFENFSNFTPELYTVWNFGKATNNVRHFGNVPPEIIDNLLYYYTNPFDVIFDPFGGGGSTIDKCIERKRRYYVSDLTPIPARETEIRQWDINDGLPDDLPVPDFVFLDPPYWKQAENKYSKKETDLGNVDLDYFLNSIADITKNIKRKWANKPQAKLALIIGPYKNNGKYVDLPFLYYQTISKYLSPVQRIQVPYSTQVHGGNYVNMAKEAKELLYLSRDLMIFGL